MMKFDVLLACGTADVMGERLAFLFLMWCSLVQGLLLELHLLLHVLRQLSFAWTVRDELLPHCPSISPMLLTGTHLPRGTPTLTG